MKAATHVLDHFVADVALVGVATGHGPYGAVQILCYMSGHSVTISFNGTRRVISAVVSLLNARYNPGE